MYITTKAPMPSRQKPRKVPRIFFQVKSRRMPLLPFFAPFLPRAAALRAAALPPVAMPSLGVPDERVGGAARRPPR
jgi:hypothetical protein